MKQILCSDWLHERARWAHVARWGFRLWSARKSSVSFWPCNKSSIEKTCSVQIAWYWPRYLKKDQQQQQQQQKKTTWSISSHLDLTVVTHMLYIAESGKKRTLRGRWLDVCPFRRIYNAYLQQSWNLECMPEEGRTWFYIKSPGADLGFPKRAPKAQASSGDRGRAPSGNFLDFYLKSPCQGFRVIQKGFQLGKCFF